MSVEEKVFGTCDHLINGSLNQLTLLFPTTCVLYLIAQKVYVTQQRNKRSNLMETEISLQDKYL